MFRERGFEVDHSTINRRGLAYAPMIETRSSADNRNDGTQPVATAASNLERHWSEQPTHQNGQLREQLLVAT